MHKPAWQVKIGDVVRGHDGDEPFEGTITDLEPTAVVVYVDVTPDDGGATTMHGLPRDSQVEVLN